MAEKIVRFAIVGSTGAIGSTQMGCAKLVGVSVRTKLAVVFSLKNWVSNHTFPWNYLFADEDIAAVIISTPHPFHAYLTSKIAKWGERPVLTEKPMSLTPKTAQNIIDSAKSANVKLPVLYMMRFHAAYVKAWRFYFCRHCKLYQIQFNWTSLRIKILLLELTGEANGR